MSGPASMAELLTGAGMDPGQLELMRPSEFRELRKRLRRNQLERRRQIVQEAERIVDAAAVPARGSLDFVQVVTRLRELIQAAARPFVTRTSDPDRGVRARERWEADRQDFLGHALEQVTQLELWLTEEGKTT